MLTIVQAMLERSDPGTPWGFRLGGGRDFGQPLAIQRVTPGSISHNCGVQVGDRLVSINHRDTSTMMHKDAQNAIRNGGNSVHLKLERTRSGAQQTFVGGASAPQPFKPSPIGSQFSPQSVSKPWAPSNTGYNNPSAVPSHSRPKPNKGPRPYISPGACDVLIKLKNCEEEKPSADTHTDQIQKQSTSFAMLHKHLFKAPKQMKDKAMHAPVSVESPQAHKPLCSALFRPEDKNIILNPKPLPTNQPFLQHAGYGGPPPPPSPSMTSPSMWAPPKPPSGGGTRRFGKIGEAVMQQPGTGRIPICSRCNNSIRGPFVVALNKSWCPDHFYCSNPNCQANLMGIGFVEENGQLYCERDFAQHFAPRCARCHSAVIGECTKAMEKEWHPQCFTCTKCRQPLGGKEFHIDDGKPYCKQDYAEMFTTKCFSCEFPIEAGDKWVEAMGQNFHSECFNCSTCQTNLEGQPFFERNGKPYCKTHAGGTKTFRL